MPGADKFTGHKKAADNAGLGRILRAGIELPAGQSASNRTDIEVLFDGLPEPIDLELDLKNRLLYWTDRGDPPRGNTVNRAPMDADSKTARAPEILFTHLMEGIGIALDFEGGRMFLTDLAGSVYSARLDGSGKADTALRSGKPHWHRLRGTAPQGEVIMSLEQTYPPNRDRRHRGHRRAGPRSILARLRRGRDRPRSERGSQLAQVR